MKYDFNSGGYILEDDDPVGCYTFVRDVSLLNGVCELSRLSLAPATRTAATADCAAP
ncbi:hypothetical protein BIFADO_01527 [Bifidobacterium adolescentis L2-32]|uniref:Uncharacterized protein n=1 Tax=Bifidobacterium adolescentis L2-32 TaxID=411481 RepID=A7A6P4_BIFAD|nr:hypothetical protein BIFADO_01527 [Bifidobacterium adolescentis L2-32]